MKKIVGSGLLAGLIMGIVGMGLSYLFNMVSPSLQAEYQNENLFRAWEDPLMMIMPLYYFIFGIILTWIWNKTKSLIRGTTGARGLRFGLTVWLMISIPGMFMTYTSFALSFSIVLSWTVMGLVNAILVGLLFAKLNK